VPLAFQPVFDKSPGGSKHAAPMRPEPPRRDLSVDLARGLACLLMIQTHAFHGWVRPDLQDDPWFRATRWLGAFPLPAFLLLSGVSVALQLGAAQARGVRRSRVAEDVAYRGALLVAGGYATNVAWGLLDGARSLPTLLRVDVLHAIGVALLIVAGLVAVTSGHTRDRRDLSALAWLSAGVALGVTFVCPWVTRFTREVQGPWRYALGLVAEVQGLSVMPAIPLLAWCALGLSVGLWKSRDVTMPGGADRAERWLLALVGGGATLTGAWATQALLLNGEALSRASVAVWPNALEGAGRGLLLLAAGAWLSLWAARETPLRRGVRDVLLHFGRASLWVYVLHVPFCYGRLAFGLRRGLSLPMALPCVLLLLLASYAVARAFALRKARSRGAAALRSSF